MKLLLDGTVGCSTTVKRLQQQHQQHHRHTDTHCVKERRKERATFSLRIQSIMRCYTLFPLSFAAHFVVSIASTHEISIRISISKWTNSVVIQNSKRKKLADLCLAICVEKNKFTVQINSHRKLIRNKLDLNERWIELDIAALHNFKWVGREITFTPKYFHPCWILNAMNACKRWECSMRRYHTTTFRLFVPSHSDILTGFWFDQLSSHSFYENCLYCCFTFEYCFCSYILRVTCAPPNKSTLLSKHMYLHGSQNVAKMKKEQMNWIKNRNKQNANSTTKHIDMRHAHAYNQQTRWIKQINKHFVY